MARLTGKIALVSGGARGMGAAHARAIVANGGNVVIGDILESEGKALASELGESARFIKLDVTKTADWNAAVKLALTDFGRLNVLVNNAGIAPFATIEDFTEVEWNTTISVNLTGPFLGIKAAVAALKASAPSSIINISSTSGFIGTPGLHGYVSSKFGLRGLTKSVAAELGSAGVRANSIHPGYVRTPMSAGLEDNAATSGVLGRIGEPEEVSNLVVYLASDESSFSTGSEFIVDGGQLTSTPPFSPKNAAHLSAR
jgi:3alpha(or 20beta)-hydroxysteroid dehydrogenase